MCVIMSYKIIAFILLELFFFLAGSEKTSSHVGNLLSQELWAIFCSWGWLPEESLQEPLAKKQQENGPFFPISTMTWDLPTAAWVWKGILPKLSLGHDHSPHPTSWTRISWDPETSQPTSEIELSKYYGPPCMPNSDNFKMED